MDILLVFSSKISLNYACIVPSCGTMCHSHDTMCAGSTFCPTAGFELECSPPLQTHLLVFYGRDVDSSQQARRCVCLLAKRLSHCWHLINMNFFYLRVLIHKMDFTHKVHNWYFGVWLFIWLQANVLNTFTLKHCVSKAAAPPSFPSIGTHQAFHKLFLIELSFH